MLMLDPEHPEGLQVLVKTPNGEEWVDVPYIENSIVINVGALLSRWTGEYIETE
jgi:isopenicillin N synthase-like dioxygenase